MESRLNNVSLPLYTRTRARTLPLSSATDLQVRDL